MSILSNGGFKTLENNGGPANGSAKGKKTPILKSVNKAFEVLDCFKHNSSDYSINELARKLRVSKGTIHRIIITAQKCGYIEQNPETQRYQLGMKVFELGSVVAKRMNLRDESKPFLKNLSELTGETSFIVIRNGYEAVGIDRVEGHNYLRMLFLEIGKTMPLYIGAGPKVLLAHMNDDEIDRYIRKSELTRWTKYTVVDPEKIWEDIHSIREKGFALSMEDVTMGAAAVGAPIRNEHEKVIGAVSISGSSIHYEGENLVRLVDAVKDAGVEISRRMGYLND
jgi:IclR family transcriptional regulator, KDG regulon repressor